VSYLETHTDRGVTQQEQLRPDQVPNSAGGFAWAVDDWSRLHRFLVLGSEGGSYYAGERELTRENIGALKACIAADGARTVRLVSEISDAGRAPRNDPAIFALAACAGLGDEQTRRAALDALPVVCRTGTHLFQFATFVQGFRGWGRQLRRAIAGWYASRDADAIAYQVVKYRQRNGWTHRDLLRLAHPGGRVGAGNPSSPVEPGLELLFAWICHGTVPVDGGELPRIVDGYLRAQQAGSARETAELVREHRLPREALKTEHLNAPVVWEALLEDMPLTAMIRNLATMTRIGVVAPGSLGTHRVIAELADDERLRKARIHPITVLAAHRTYAAGHGVRSSATWDPVVQVIDALDSAFYRAFGNVEPSGGRFLLALDVSGSMARGEVAGVPGLTPREASAAMALVTAATEPAYEVMGFSHTFVPLAISPRQRLADAVLAVSGLPFAATDCALPMLYALDRGREVDAFVVYTDSETWFGNIHPAVALQEYRRQSGIAARLVVVGMVANEFSIADPNDPGMLDVVGFDTAGFDTATPQLISDFAAGR
jgi:60 kDa SS-A/Ro ribonucleoprotein